MRRPMGDVPMGGVSIGKLRPVAWASLIVGAAETASVATGWNANRGAPAWLPVGGLIAIGFGAFGLLHLYLLENAGSTPRPGVFVAYYWVFPLAAIACLALAAASGLENAPIVIAEVMQGAVVVLVTLWFTFALRPK
jgi:hypothetical protein